MFKRKGSHSNWIISTSRLACTLGFGFLGGRGRGRGGGPSVEIERPHFVGNRSRLTATSELDCGHSLGVKVAYDFVIVYHNKSGATVARELPLDERKVSNWSKRSMAMLK
jgi:hypothetical protein